MRKSWKFHSYLKLQHSEQRLQHEVLGSSVSWLPAKEAKAFWAPVENWKRQHRTNVDIQHNADRLDLYLFWRTFSEDIAPACLHTDKIFPVWANQTTWVPSMQTESQLVWRLALGVSSVSLVYFSLSFDFSASLVDVSLATSFSWKRHFWEAAGNVSHEHVSTSFVVFFAHSVSQVCLFSKHFATGQLNCV